MTGTYVYNVDSQAGTSEIMKYTLSNLEPGSDKLW